MPHSPRRPLARMKAPSPGSSVSASSTRPQAILRRPAHHHPHALYRAQSLLCRPRPSHHCARAHLSGTTRCRSFRHVCGRQRLPLPGRLAPRPYLPVQLSARHIGNLVAYTAIRPRHRHPVSLVVSVATDAAAAEPAPALVGIPRPLDRYAPGPIPAILFCVRARWTSATTLPLAPPLHCCTSAKPAASSPRPMRPTARAVTTRSHVNAPTASSTCCPSRSVVRAATHPISFLSAGHIHAVRTCRQGRAHLPPGKGFWWGSQPGLWRYWGWQPCPLRRSHLWRLATK